MTKVILDSNVRDHIEFDGVLIKAYQRGKHYSNVMVRNTDGAKRLRVFIASTQCMTERNIMRDIPADQMFVFRKMPRGNLTIEWEHRERCDSG